MTPTTRHMTVSLDGFVAGPDQSRENPLVSAAASSTTGTWMSRSTKLTPAPGAY